MGAYICCTSQNEYNGGATCSRQMRWGENEDAHVIFPFLYKYVMTELGLSNRQKIDFV